MVNNMLKVGIVPNLTRPKAFETVIDVTRQLDMLNIEYFFDLAQKDKLFGKAVNGIFSDSLYDISDIVIAIGGDGSFIRTAKQAAMHKKPVLCINAGNLAFLAGLEGNELTLLKNLISGDYAVDKRMMLKAVIKNDENEVQLGYFLNDVVVARGAEIKLVNLNVFSDGRMINNYRADGVIVSTPTGSTAYSWSAGGPVIDPALKCIMLTPICTHSPLNRSLVFNENSVIEIKSNDSFPQELSVSADGEDTIKTSGNCKIIISQSEYCAEFIRIKSDEFFDILNSKLTQRRV